MPEIPNTDFENKLANSNFGRMVDLPSFTPPATKSAKDMSVEELSRSIKASTTLLLDKASNPYTPQLVSPNQIDQTGRYNKQLVGWDNEDLYGSMQSNWDRAANGVLKGLQLAGTTFLQGTVGLVYGLGNIVAGNGGNSFYNNDFTQLMDRWNKAAENALPNYYTAKETNAEWYSPDNLLTANFIWDKLVKNVGFSIGAIYSGGVVSKGISAAMKSVGMLTEAAQAAKVVTALEEALPATPAAARFSKFQEILSNLTPKVSAQQVDRTITSLFGAATEGGIEALQGLNEFREAKIKEFQEKNFRMPNDEEMRDINNNAAELGNARLLMNIGLLSATNYIQLPKILGSRYTTSKAIANTEAAAAGEVGGIRRTATGTFERALPTTRIGKFARSAGNVGGLLFSGSEAFEEGAQFVIQEGVNDYYSKKYGGEGRTFLNSLYEGASQITSKEGMESILLGGFSGGLQQIRGNVKQRGITGTGGTTGAATEKFVADLNNSASMSWFKDMQDAAARGVNIMKEQEDYIRQGDVLNSKDAEANLMHNYLAVRIKHGRYDLVKDDIAALRQQSSTQDGLNKLIEQGIANTEDTIQTFNARLTNFEKHADNLKPTFEALNLRYGGILGEDGKRLYSEEVIDKMAYAVSKVADYDQRIPELSRELITNGIPVQEVIDSHEGGKFNTKEAVAAIEALDTTIDKKLDLKIALNDVLEMTDRRQSFLAQYNEAATNPTKFKEQEQNLPTGDVIQVETNTGEKDLEVGEEYYAGAKQVETNEGGVIKKFAKFTIIGEEGDNIIIKDSKTGQTQNLPKSKLANYKITKTSLADPNAVFYIENSDNIFTYNIGKKDKNPTGNVVYENGNLYFRSLDGKFNRRVTRDEFLPGINKATGKKYDVAKIYTNKKFTEKAEEALNKPVPEEETKDKFARRQEIISDLVNSSTARIEEIKKTIEQKKKQLSDIEESINNLLTTKKGLTRKKVAKAALKTIEQLGRTKIAVQNEINSLEEEQVDLENSLPYFQDLLQNLGELDENTRQAISDIKEDIASIEELIDHTKEAIKNGNSLVDKISEVLNTAYSLVKDYITRLKEESSLPTLSLEEYQDGLEKYLGETGAQQFIDNKEGFVPAIKALQAEISDFEDELGITTKEDKLKELKASLKELEGGLEDLIKEQIAKGKILEHFQGEITKFEARQAAEAAILANKEMMDKFFHQGKKAQEEAGVATASPEEQAETNETSIGERIGKVAKKAIQWLFNSTTTPAVLERESDKRHQRFLSKLPLLPNTENIVVQFVTKNNEAAFGLNGLIDKHLDGYVPKEGEELILAIYSEKDGNEVFFIDENGKRIGKQGQPTDLNTVVYAAMPSTSLTDSSGTRYQTENATPEQAAAWQKAWKEKRDEILAYTNNSPMMTEIHVSRGIPETTDDIQYISGTLVTEKQLNDGKKVIAVSTKGTIEHQGRTINIPKGRVMIQNGSILEYANNRNFNEQEVNVLYNVIKAFVKKANETGVFDNNLMAYLHGVLLFDSPYRTVDEEVVKKDVARNQMYFHRRALYMGNKEFSVPFTEASIEANKADVMGFLRLAYNHVNVKLLDQNRPFNELNADLSIKKEWPTYQHYLLSSEGRTKEEVPLSTKIRPIDPAIPNDRNFNSKYSYFPLIKVEEEQAPIVNEEAEDPFEDPELIKILADNAAALAAEKGTTPSAFSVSNFKDEGEAPQGGPVFTLDDVFGGKAEPTEVVQPKDTGKTMAQWRAEQSEEPPSPQGESNFRVVGAYNYALANIEAEKEYIEKNSPFSIETIKNLIAAGNGLFAWGSYQNAIITLSERMEEGTGYHELFEGVYDVFLNAGEKKLIYKEFANRKGTFVDRQTGGTIKFSEATLFQAKEQMAEDFRDYKLNGTLPSSIAKQSKLAQFFNDLLNWIKSVFTGEIYSLDNMFARMDSAFYKNTPFKNSPTTKLNARVIGSLNALSTDAVIKGVVSNVFQEIYKEGDTKLINELDFQGKIPLEIYDRIRRNLLFYYTKTYDGSGKIIPYTAFADLTEKGMSPQDIDNLLLPVVNSVFGNWDQIITASGELLKTFKILQEEENTKEDDEVEHGGRDEGYLADAFQWDGKKNAPASIKLLIATLQESVFVATGAPAIGEQPLRDIRAIRDASTIMQKMVDYAKTFNALLDQLSSENSLLDKEKKIRKLADSVPEYVRIFTRLRLNQDGEMSVNDWALRIKFYNTFAKQRPIALNTYINEDGSTSIGAADLDNAVKQLSNNWLAGLKSLPNISYEDDRYILNVDAKDKNGVYIIPHDTTGPKQRYKYLSVLGINFTAEQISNFTKEDATQLADAVSSLRTRLEGKANVTSLYKLQVKGPLDKIFKIFLSTQNLIPASVFSDLQGNYRQTFVQTNAASRIANDINNASTREQLLELLPHLGQEYSKDSDYINSVLFNEEGENLNKELLIKYIQGIVTRDGDKNVPTEKLSEAKKLMQAINQNLNENYYILIPADSQTEWMIGLRNKYLGLTDAALEQFYSYYQTEQQLGGSKSRLFSMLKDGLTEEQFNKAFSEFVYNEATQQFKQLLDYNIIQAKSDGKYDWTGLDKSYAEKNNLNHKSLSLEQVEQIIMERTVNFMYNNTEIHKMFFGDPGAYTKGTRRYKSFLSPREQALYDTPDFDTAANKEYHTVAGVELKKGDPGYLLYRNALKTISTSDVLSANELPGYLEINGSDGQGIATLVAYKQMRIKNGFRWSSNDEANAQYAFAEDRLLMAKDGLYKYTDKALREHDEALTSKPLEKKARFSPLKPIVSGFNSNGPLLDKYSIAAITYKAVRGTNWALQYKRMLDNQVGYMIYESGRKVGVRKLDSIYNTDAYPTDSIEEVPFKWFGIQVETGGDEKSQTWGSQIGKLNTVNLLNAGVPIDFDGDYDTWYDMSEADRLKASPIIYKLIVKERDVRVAMIENGYKQLLEKVGINEDGTVSKKKLLDVITDELTRRELNDNIKSALKMEGDDFYIPLEALNNYEQIKSIIFSYVSKYISSPKVSGGAKIQVSGSGWEVAGQRIVKGKNKEGKTIYTATGLKFYTKEEPWMEVMLPNWFASKIRQIPSLRDLTNDELIHYINNSPDMKEILSGIGFRIPTQELNSIENFRVKAFLPEEFGDMVVVPEALTKKSGGDFDVDKLNTYLKNVYINSIGELAVVPYFGQGEEAVQKFRDLISSGNLVEKLLNIGKSKFDPESKSYEQVLEEMTYGPEEALEDAKDAEQLAQRMYKQSLENEYFRTLDQILSLEQNFDRLVAPNHSDELIALRNILEGISEEEFGQGAIKSVLSPTYMNRLRHMYISGKSNVGIAASAQTQNAVSQKTPIIIDPSKRTQLKEGNERDYIGDAKVHLPANTIKIKGVAYQTISLAKDKVGRYISDKISQFINGFVDIAADPFLVQIGVTKDNAGTFMFLERIGVPTDTTVYFMNQPIIREYTKMLERNGLSYPYIQDNIDEILQQFPTNKEIPTQFPTKGLETALKTNIDQYYNHKLSAEENAFQHFVLFEYLKYSIMASNLFRLSQATNYDTAKFSDGWLYFRKALKTKDAETNNIFSSASESMNNTFVGPLANRVGGAIRKISNSFFKFLHEGINPYIFPVMEALANRKKMTDLDFQKAARKVEQSFINYLSQISSKLNDRIKELLIDEETSAARLLEQMKARVEALPNNPFKVLSSFITEDKNSPTSTKTIKIFNKGTTVFEQNTFIAAMQELQNNPAMKELYGKLARVAFLQSGVAKSPISFTELLPVDTFKAFILPAIESLSSPELMKGFIETGTFYKNNWKDPNIVPKIAPKIEYEMNEHGGDDEIVKQEYNSPSLVKYAKDKGNTNFRAFKVSTKAGNFSSDYLTITLGKGKDRQTWLLKKLIDPNTSQPILQSYSSKYPENQYGIYYAVNPLGDGYKGQEHYSNVRKSVFNNEGVKQEAELTPDEVMRAIRGEITAPKTTKQLAPTEEDFEAFKNQLPRKDC